ncbi:DMT family transporter [Lactococcus lactis]|jgi:drug/metabolite transporter (DMT)-like permease|uniref:DMT family transporter n=1 Tax=Lactococcus lactis TaxID=1358 RepID=UPI0020268EB1|nr:DMT family transporter [Lactococcus lactis]MCL9640023.1 DMT family transporter [Lactococcus lactis]USI47333.1 DMT family transporter [Lactococcus lactis]WKF72259.1 DMT family transporter [Lactococcus lactis]BDH81836.1 membrane protein [Lactococcus lactis]
MTDALKKNVPKATTIAVAAVIANIIWGTPFKLIKVMNNEMKISPEIFGKHYLGQVLATISLRFFIAGIMTLIFAKFIKQNIFNIKKRQWREVIIMGLLSTTAAYFFFNIANVNITSTINSTILAQSTIFFAAILAHFTYKNDKLTPIKVIGLVIGFMGLIISQLTGGVRLSDMFSFSLTGEGFMLIYGLLAALATMLAKRIGSTLNSFVMTGWNLIIGSLGLYIIGFVMGGRLSAINWTVTGGALLIILAAASAIPFSLWYWAAQYGNLGEITVYKFIMPISGSILAVLLGESVTVSLMVGLALVCLSIILINRPPKFEGIKESLRKVDQV